MESTMSKETKTDTADAKPKAPPPSLTVLKDGDEATVVMRRKARAGNDELDVGEVVAHVKLRPGVDLNYLGAAIGNGICGRWKAPPEK